MDRRNYAIGIALLGLVVVMWTGSSFLLQNLMVTGYNKPWFVTYVNTSTFTLYLLPHVFRRWGHKPLKAADSRGSYASLPPSPPIAGQRSLSRRRSAHSMSPPPHPPLPLDVKLPPLTTRETANLAAVFCVLWFIANWPLNASLEFTSVGSSTILTSMSGFFTLAVGRMFGVETFTLGKLGAVIISFAGVVLVSLADHSSSTPATSPYALFGDFLALLSAICYAFYVTFLKLRTQHESRLDSMLFFGFVGLFSMIGIWPVGFVLNFLRWERFELPHDGKSWGALVINMIITLLSDYMYLLAMLKTTPLAVTIGLSLTIPLAVLGDFFLGHRAGLQTLAGAMLVLTAFGAIGWEDMKGMDPLGKVVGGVGDSYVGHVSETINVEPTSADEPAAVGVDGDTIEEPPG